MSSASLVIFDCDGVLVDSEPLSNAVLSRLLAQEGLELTLAQTRAAYQGKTLAQVVQNAGERIGRPLGERWLARYERERAEVFRASLKGVPGMRDCVLAVRRRGMAVCVASQGSLEKTRLSLDLTGLSDLFEDSWLFSADMVARGKPFPDLFLHAARSMGAAPADSVVVEDTPSGVRAGVAAGMRVYGYAADSDSDALARAGAEIVRSAAELIPLLTAP